MSTITADNVRSAIMEYLESEADPAKVSSVELDEELDLMGSGVLDSFGVLELIGWIERRFALELDLEDVEPVDLTTVGPLSRLVASAGDSTHVRDASADGTERLSAPPPTPPTPPEHAGVGRRRSLGVLAAEAHVLFSRAAGKSFSLLVRGSFAAFGKQSVLQPPIRLHGHDRISIGSGVFVGRGGWLQTIEAEPGERGRIVIGDGTSMAGNCTVSAAVSVEIGQAVSFARGVYVADHAHSYSDPSQPILAQGITDIRPVAIGDGAWLGQNAVVLPGVRIGKGAVVGANSVVTSDIPDYSVVAGIPARLVRRFGPTA
jgi:acetyltransferase-like isoleucine patch superfamily enzyme/acyl carrier protein